MRKYAQDFLQKGGGWLGSLRERFKTMFICGNGETIYWGSDQEVKPNPTMKQIEELGAYAVSGYHGEVVEPMLEQLREYRELLRKVIQDNHIEMVLTQEVEKKVQRLSIMIDNQPEWVLQTKMKEMSNG